jgi:hypothetical protein
MEETKMPHLKGVAVVIVFIMVALSIAMVTPPLPAQAPAATFVSNGTAIMQMIAGVGTFTGTLTTNGFTLANGAISAMGTVSGQLTDTAGNVTVISAQPVTLLLASFTGTCTTLTLHSGPITFSEPSLSAKGVSLGPIDVVITAPASPDSQLSSLICSLGTLVGSNSPLANVVIRLNDILAAIRGSGSA